MNWGCCRLLKPVTITGSLILMVFDTFCNSKNNVLKREEKKVMKQNLPGLLEIVLRLLKQ